MSETNPPAWAVERAWNLVTTLTSDTGLGWEIKADLINAIASALTIPKDHVRLPSGEVVPIICVSYAGRAACPGKTYDGEPMQDIRIAYPIAESARAGGGA